MSALDPVVDAVLAGNQVGLVRLVEMQFRSGVARLALGRSIVAGGHEWSGAGDLIRISALQYSRRPKAIPLTLTLSGNYPELQELIASRANAGPDEYTGRSIKVLQQCMNTTDGAWTPVGPLLTMFTGSMRSLALDMSGPSSFSVTLNCENIWINRRRPRYGMLTDRDQQRRFPGDRGLEFVPTVVDLKIQWPTF